MTLQKIREGEKLLKIILLLIASCLHLMVYASEPVEISGTIVIPQGVRIPDGGLDVVLLKFVVNDQGEITTTGPQARVKSQKDGSFRIPNIPRELRAAFRIGTRVRGRLHQSNVIFMNEEDSVYQVEVLIPGLSEKVEVLELEKASLILERGLGKIRVTEVWEIKNPTSDMVDSVKAGFRSTCLILFLILACLMKWDSKALISVWEKIGSKSGGSFLLEAPNWFFNTRFLLFWGKW